MKKLGFTLAEVLITLSIIGVVASMTMPALMTNTQEQQAITGLKKGINTLTEAAQMNNSMEGWDYATATNTPTDIKTDNAVTLRSEVSFTGLLYNKTAVDFSKGVALPADMKTKLEGASAVYFKDGTALYYVPATVTSNADKAKLQADNLPLGFTAWFDTNGTKGPNIVSNCAAAPLGVDETQTAAYAIAYEGTNGAKAKCEADGAKVIKDIFTVRFRGNVVEPEGYASVYVMNRK